MGVGDGFGQTEDHLGGGVGGAGVIGGLLGDDGDGVGVEAAAVVVITLLAVLGNAMVVATLVRRSLLHHPSNRLVLSLTGSNLLLTVVVLPGMVTSLLMTPASPNSQHPTLSQSFNNSSAAQNTIEPLSLFINEQGEASDLLQHPNSSAISPDQPHSSSSHQGNKEDSINIPLHNASSLGYDEGTVTLPPFLDPEVQSPVSEYFTTELPLYLRVSSDGLDPSMYSHRDISVLSQEVQGSHHSPLQHGAAGPISLEEQEVKHHQILTKNDENELTSVPDDRFSELGPKLAEVHQKQNISTIQDHKNDKIQLSQAEEIKSLMVNSQIRKSSADKESNGNMQLKTEIKSFTRNERKANFPQSSNQHSERKPNIYVSINVNHQDVLQESKRKEEHSDIYQQEIVSLNHNNKLSNYQQEMGRHAPSRRRRKQAPRHYQHRKQRLRRIRADPGEESSDQHLHDRVSNVDNVETSDIQDVLLAEKSLAFTLNKINEENNIEDVDSTVMNMKRINDNHQNESDDEHVQEMVQLHIREQSRREGSSEEEEHLILVRGVQEAEEAQDEKVLLLLVDQEFDQKKRVDVKLEQRLDDLYQRLNEPDLPREEMETIEKKDHTVDHLPKLAALDQKSSLYLKENDNENLVNQTESEKRTLDEHHPQEDQLPEFQAQTLELRSNRETTLGGQNYLKAEREVAENEKDSGEIKTEAENVQQMYGGIEWESERWEGGRILCQGAAFFTNLVTAASALTVAVIAIDRYLAIVRPLVYGVMVTRGRCLIMLIWCWSQAFLTALPPLLGWARYERREPYGRCGVAWGESPSYTACWTISVFLVPFSIMIVCYYHILQVARNKCRRIRVGKVSENSPPNTPDPASACIDGFPFPLSVAHLMAPPLGSKLVSAQPPSPMLTKLPSLGNLAHPSVERQVSYPPGNHTSHPLVRNTARGLTDSRLDGMPCRSHSVSGMLRAVDSTTTNPNDSANKPKRKLGNFGRSRSLCQVPQQPPRPCLRRVQSTFSVRHTLKKLSLGTRRPSWNWEGSPSKGFWTIFVVMGAHLLTWGPYTCMAVAEAILGHDHLLIIPHWVMVTCTLLLFTASVFYPIVYGLYNRNIRKEILTCLCPSWTRKRGSQARRPSTLPSYTGSVLDFTSLHHRSAVDKPDFGYNPANGIMGPIATISSRVGSLACPAPLMLMGEDDPLCARGYNLNLRKPSQDSGTVMVGSEDQDSDVDTPAPTPRQYTTRRVSAPSVLSTVREDPHTTTVCIEDTHQVIRHHSINCRNTPSVPHRKNAIFPLAEPLSFKRVVSSSLRRSRSLDKISSSEKEITLDSTMTYRSLRKKRSTPIMRETQFNTPTPTPTPSERIQRRRGSIAVMKVTAIPEDCGLMEYPEVTDSGRGSVDSGRVSRHRMMHGRGSTDSTDLTKTFSLRCRGSIDSADHAKAQGFSRRGSMDSTELAIARSKKRENRDGLDLGKNPATRQVSIDEGIGSECLPEESNWE